MTAAGERVGLVAFLGQAAERCQAAIETGSNPELAAVRRYIVPALAVLRTVLGQPEINESDLSLVRGAASDASAACRTHEPSDELAAVVTCFEDVILAADAMLGGEPVVAPAWERFLFPDADVEVRRESNRWVVRVGGRSAAHTFLDAALEQVLSVSQYRIARITVQILAWVEFRAPYGRDG